MIEGLVNLAIDGVAVASLKEKRPDVAAPAYALGQWRQH